MPNNFKYLSHRERILIILASISVLASIVLALCIGLVLPYHWTMENYVKNDNKGRMEDYIAKCHCDHRKHTTNYLNCVPSSFSQRNVSNETQLPKTTCELIQNYPYLVSLNIPAYNDDANDKRYACSGTILSNIWILVGRDCIYLKDELKHLKVRAGSTHWSMGGTEHNLTELSEFNLTGPIALRVNPPFAFNKFISAVRVPRKAGHISWVSAVSAAWGKDSQKKYNKFNVQKWTTMPCADDTCQKGEVGDKFNCGEETFDKALVADGRLLIGLHSGICSNHENISIYTFIDVQTKHYNRWFKFLLGSSAKRKEQKTGNTSTLLKIYEVTECTVLDASFTDKENEETTATDFESTKSTSVTVTDHDTQITTDKQVTDSLISDSAVQKILTSEKVTVTVATTASTTTTVEIDTLRNPKLFSDDDRRRRLNLTLEKILKNR